MVALEFHFRCGYLYHKVASPKTKPEHSAPVFYLRSLFFLFFRENRPFSPLSLSTSLMIQFPIKSLQKSITGYKL